MVCLTTISAKHEDGRTKAAKLKFDHVLSLKAARKCIGVPSGWNIYAVSTIKFKE